MKSFAARVYQVVLSIPLGQVLRIKAPKRLPAIIGQQELML